MDDKALIKELLEKMLNWKRNYLLPKNTSKNTPHPPAEKSIMKRIKKP